MDFSSLKNRMKRKVSSIFKTLRTEKYFVVSENDVAQHQKSWVVEDPETGHLKFKPGIWPENPTEEEPIELSDVVVVGTTKAILGPSVKLKMVKMRGKEEAGENDR